MCGRAACALSPEQLCLACTRRCPVVSVGNADHSTVASSSQSEGDWKSSSTKEENNNNEDSDGETAFEQSVQQDKHNVVCPVLLSGSNEALSALPTDNFSSCPPSDMVLLPMHWGLVPSYYKAGPISACKLKPINAKLETLREQLRSHRGMFYLPLKKQHRCVVPVDGFYEWTGPQKERQPYFVYNKQAKSIDLADASKETVDADGRWTGRKLLMMAALFERVILEGEECSLYSFAVITTVPPDWFKTIHDRIPVILESDDAIAKWLDPNVSSEDAIQALKHGTVQLEWHQVDRKFVGDLKYRGPDCVKPKLELSPIKTKEQKKREKHFPAQSTNLLNYFSPRGSTNKKGPAVKNESEDDDDGPAPKKRNS